MLFDDISLEKQLKDFNGSAPAISKMTLCCCASCPLCMSTKVCKQICMANSGMTLSLESMLVRRICVFCWGREGLGAISAKFHLDGRRRNT